MSDQLLTGLFTVLSSIVGVAIIAVLVSSNSQTSKILSTGGQSFATALSAATAPVTSAGSFGSFSGGNGSLF